MKQGAATPGELLLRCHAAAIQAVQPEAALHRPLREGTPGTAPCWIISVGKASEGMARAIVEWLGEHGREPAGGIVVAPATAASPHSALDLVAGDHPIPGARSAHAAAAISRTIEAMPSNAAVHVAISGGASALMAGPLPPLTERDVIDTFDLLLSSGLDIREMNAVRKRITRWSAGRLALQLAPRVPHVWIISDVAGDDLGSIASGPCTGDDWTSEQVLDLLTQHALLARLPERVQEAMTRETPKPTDRWLSAIPQRIVANNAAAVAAAVRAAEEAGVRAVPMATPLQGDAATMGREIAATVPSVGSEPQIQIWGGETTVTMAGSSDKGGRSQELALAASELLRGRSEVLLAAGTDGRDGPTDAAGAIVDGETWNRITASGRDPARDLAQHDAYPALDAAGALVRTGPTGTNVMDLVLLASGWS